MSDESPDFDVDWLFDDDPKCEWKRIPDSAGEWVWFAAPLSRLEIMSHGRPNFLSVYEIEGRLHWNELGVSTPIERFTEGVTIILLFKKIDASPPTEDVINAFFGA